MYPLVIRLLFHIQHVTCPYVCIYYTAGCNYLLHKQTASKRLKCAARAVDTSQRCFVVEVKTTAFSCYVTVVL